VHGGFFSIAQFAAQLPARPLVLDAVRLRSLLGPSLAPRLDLYRAEKDAPLS